MRTPLIAAALAATTLLLAACGDDERDTAEAPPTVNTAEAPPAASSTPATEPAGPTSVPDTVVAKSTVDSATAASLSGAETSMPTSVVEGSVPQAIVSLSPVHTEMLFAIGAGDLVVAVDDQSNYPPEAESVRTDLSGFEPNVEAIASYEPDLVIAQSDNVQAPLEELGIAVWVGPPAASLDDAYDQIEQLGAATGHIAEAAEVVATMQTDIQAIVDSMPELDAPLEVYHELSPDFYTADSTTFIGQVYRQLGLQNIADRAEGDHGGYPQLSAEAIISADPDLIFLADAKCCGETAETVAQRDGWESMVAVTEGRVYEMDDDVASRWGPRIVEYYQQVAEAVTAAAGVPAGG